MNLNKINYSVAWIVFSLLYCRFFYQSLPNSHGCLQTFAEGVATFDEFVQPLVESVTTFNECLQTFVESVATFDEFVQAFVKCVATFDEFGQTFVEGVATFGEFVQTFVECLSTFDEFGQTFTLLFRPFAQKRVKVSMPAWYFYTCNGSSYTLFLYFF